MPNLIISKKAESDFTRFPEIQKKKIIKKLELLQSEPFSGKLLRGKLKGFWSLRAWPYRIIYGLSKRNKILIYRIIHRQKAYK